MNSNDNLWILTEERPKVSVIKKIIELFSEDFSYRLNFGNNNLVIKPIVNNGIFNFIYEVQNVEISYIKRIYIKTVSGNSSFFDFLVFKQEKQPIEGNFSEEPIMAIEETKTGDDESRNTGVYQRGSKFVFIDTYYPNVKKYMLYNDEHYRDDLRKPSDTSIFGTNMLLTLGVKIVGKDVSKWFRSYRSLDELITQKNNMRKPPKGNVPITISKGINEIRISGRLAKPADAGNIAHDPNIGGLAMISKCIRRLGWDKTITITSHGVSQDYIDKTKGNNKFLFICNQINLQLEGIKLPLTVPLPELYWHYENSSEKVASILLHMICSYCGMKCVYENHAGCERGYFWNKNNVPMTLPKKNKNGSNLLLPDVVLYDNVEDSIILVEGKKYSTLEAGLKEIDEYQSIENEYIKIYYPNSRIYRFVSIFGGNVTKDSGGAGIKVFNPKVLLFVNTNGKIYLNGTAPECIKNAFKQFGVAPEF